MLANDLDNRMIWPGYEQATGNSDDDDGRCWKMGQGVSTACLLEPSGEAKKRH